MESEIRHLSKFQKVALIIAFVWVFLCLIGALSNGLLLVMLVCSALLAAVACLFNDILDAKYAWVVLVASFILPFVTIGATFEPEDESTNQETEEVVSNQVVESESSNTPNETTEKVVEKKDVQLSQKEKEIADAGFKKGTMYGMAGASNETFTNMLELADYVDGGDDKVNEMLENMAGDEYDREYGAPTTAEEKKLKKIYVENFIKAMNGTMDGMDVLEKISGKR